ncbi:carcinoembryonic antigen-related cell adhesion molecule 1-like [Acipenser ruthenus]|uniref:carcinoembryonic antigen-related cell adhesion molecule 1-like n=1 Tax=Acipenser ruthenus TaxID=7906 RepID=UPI002741A2FE|nr:carcinoembryonic antigen-related cell adhesion molecule 1-like [Acipenser ruthenus]
MLPPPVNQLIFCFLEKESADDHCTETAQQRCYGISGAQICEPQRRWSVCISGPIELSGNAEHINGKVTLKVYEPVSQPTVRSNVTDPVEFNDTVSLTCTASGSAVSYRWFIGSSVVSDSERIHLSDDNKTLTIPRVLRSDDGTLYCYAFNPVSNSTSEPFHLIVSYGPESLTLSISPQKPIYSAGSDLTLSCSAQSSPPAHYQWFFNGAPLNKLGSQLNMAHIQHNQTGNYTCWVYNNVTLRYAQETRAIIVVGK